MPSLLCMNDMQSIINAHNIRTIKNARTSNAKTCNCRKRESCPLSDECLSTDIVYKATVVSNIGKASYISLASGPFKTRYNNHTKSFRNDRYQKETELSKHIWSLKKKNEKKKSAEARRKYSQRHIVRTPTQNDSTGEYRERAIHRASKHQQPNSREEPVWRRDRNEDQRRSLYNNTRERQRSHHARAVSDETSRIYGTERSYGFATKESCYNCVKL